MRLASSCGSSVGREHDVGIFSPACPDQVVMQRCSHATALQLAQQGMLMAWRRDWTRTNGLQSLSLIAGVMMRWLSQSH